MKEYKYYVGTKEIVCEYIWHGKKYYGKAKCHPTDTFDIEKGKELAKARVEVKVAKARRQLAISDCKDFAYAAEVYKMSYMNALEYFKDAEVKYNFAKEKCADIENSI